MPDPEFSKCPQCQTVVKATHPKYPDCWRCGEFLRSHRYCEHFEAVTQECLHTEVVHKLERVDPEARATIADLDERHNCEYFESLIGVGAPTSFQRLIGPVIRVGIVTGIVAALMLVWFVNAMREQQVTAEQRDIEFEVICPDTAYENQMFEVQCIVRNRDEREVPALELRLNERFFAYFEMLDVSPPPSNLWVHGAGRYLQYEHLAGKSEMLIQFRMRGSQVGSYELAVQLNAPGQFQSEMTKYPVDVM